MRIGYTVLIAVVAIILLVLVIDPIHATGLLTRKYETAFSAAALAGYENMTTLKSKGLNFKVSEVFLPRNQKSGCMLIATNKSAISLETAVIPAEGLV